MSDPTNQPQQEAPAGSQQPQKPQQVQQVLLGQTTTPPVILADKTVVTPEYSGAFEPILLPSVELTHEYTTPEQQLHDRTDIDGNSEFVAFHSEVSAEADARMRALVSPSALGTGKGRDWNEALVSAATTSAYRDGAFRTTVADPEAAWKQYLISESGKIGFTGPQFKEGGDAYSGEKAMLRVKSLLGMGGIVSIPLYHSGFWVTLSRPSDGEMIELRRRMQQDKMDLGRMTFGLVFSNEQVYLNSWLFEFCMSKLYDTTARVDNPKTELRDLIKIQDLNILFWGLACLIWPRGFDYVRPLTTVDGIENTQTVSAKINVSKLKWVDNNSFSKEQNAQMARRGRGSVTVEEIKKYQETFMPSLSQGRRIQVVEGLDLMLSTPSVSDYIVDGETWISSIVEAVDSTFTVTAPEENQRIYALEQQSRAARTRNYGAWIKSVIINDHVNEEADVVYSTLEDISTNDELHNKVTEAVRQFRDDCTRALIAIPATNGQQSGVPRFANLIPIDVINVFFTLLAQRVAIISRR